MKVKAKPSLSTWHFTSLYLLFWGALCLQNLSFSWSRFLVVKWCFDNHIDIVSVFTTVSLSISVTHMKKIFRLFLTQHIVFLFQQKSLLTTLILSQNTKHFIVRYLQDCVVDNEVSAQLHR